MKRNTCLRDIVVINIWNLCNKGADKMCDSDQVVTLTKHFLKEKIFIKSLRKCASPNLISV